MKSGLVVIVLLISLAISLTGCMEETKKLDTTTLPEGAIVLFDGTDLSKWTSDKGEPSQWKIEKGALEVAPGTGSLMTKQTFQDFQLHLEFSTPDMPDKKGQVKGNSGVYIQRRYEVQILDSYGLEPKYNGCGSIYKIKPPDVNVCKEPGLWQTYDITFHTPKFKRQGAEFVKTENARITVYHNETLIHDDFEIPNKTGAGFPEGPNPMPLLLQDHWSKVRFANIWIKPLN